jgi:hypothetical protein
MRRSVLRYSLRSLLVLTAVSAVVVYWLILPTLNARRFTAAINSGQYEVAERLCVEPADVFPGTWKDHQTFEPKAGIQPLSWEDFRGGQRRMFVGIAYGDGGGIASCSLECSATRQGVEIGMFMP